MAFSINIQLETGTQKLEFYQCILDVLGYRDDNRAEVAYSGPHGRNISVSPSSGSSLWLSHSPNCSCRALRETDGADASLSVQVPVKSVRLAVCVLVYDADGRVLLTRRHQKLKNFPRFWVLPGGHVDEGETLEQSAAREVLEETGLQVDPGNMRAFAMWESLYPISLEEGIPRAHHLVLFFSVILPYAQPLRLQTNEIDAVAWLSRDEALGWLLCEEQKPGAPVLHTKLSSIIMQPAADVQQTLPSKFSGLVPPEAEKGDDWHTQEHEETFQRTVFDMHSEWMGLGHRNALLEWLSVHHSR